MRGMTNSGFLYCLNARRCEEREASPVRGRGTGRDGQRALAGEVWMQQQSCSPDESNLCPSLHRCDLSLPPDPGHQP